MKITFVPDAWDHYIWWQTQDRKTLRRINTLVGDITRNGYEGIGKPEPLRNSLSGYWSRRITGEHRLIYRIADEDTAVIISCRFHYGE